MMQVSASGPKPQLLLAESAGFFGSGCPNEMEFHSAVLPKGFAEERFAFFGTALSGKTEQPPRSQRGVSLLNSRLDETGKSALEGRGVLGNALGEMYAHRYFSPET